MSASKTIEPEHMPCALATLPEFVMPALQGAPRVVRRHLLDHIGLKVDEGHRSRVTLIQCLGSDANLKLHLPCSTTARLARNSSSR